jgi:broad specificity phosphatase PhoE
METLYLVRHAAAESNRDGTTSCTPPGGRLTEEGIGQALGLAESIAGVDVTLGVATRLARTQETLELALGRRSLPRLVVPDLDEIHFGSFDGGLLASYRAWAASHPPDEPAPGGGESRAQAAGGGGGRGGGGGGGGGAATRCSSATCSTRRAGSFPRR